MQKSAEGVSANDGVAAARQPARVAIVLGLATVYVVWGSTYLAMHIAIETLPPFLLAGTRFLVAGLIAYGWVCWWHGVTWPSGRDVVDAFVGGGLMLLGGNGAVVWALQTVPTGLAALVVATVPLWVALIDWTLPHGTRPDVRTSLSLVLGLAGVAWLIVPKTDAGAGVPVVGGLLLVLSSMSWAVGSHYIRARSHGRREPFLKTAALQMLAGSSLLLLAALIHGEFSNLDVSKFSAESLAAMGYLIVAGSLLSYTVHGWLLTVVRPTLVATYAFVNPVIAVLLGCVFLKEELSRDKLMAGGVVVAAVALMVLARPRSPKIEPSTAKTLDE